MKKKKEIQGAEEILEERIKQIQRNREWRRSLLEMVIFLAAVYVIFQYVLGIASVKGDSMLPALKEGEVLLFYRLDQRYHPGDILIIHMPDQTEYVKRVVAVEGDVVDIEEETGRVLVNGDPLEEPYIYAQTHRISDKVDFPLEVGPDEIFVLGDNREISKDSRVFGCVSVSQVTGRVLLHTGAAF
ncbi:MAG: signal peptidase I [Lachnospiraceae bacterium]|nr:signal peptidase I [Lachnospiraceae bacterium]